jgi:hypothetical protein
MYYGLVKITGDSNNYFIKSKYPIRNKQQMLNKMALKYDKWNKEDFVMRPCTFTEYYLGILLDKIVNK